MTKFLSIVAIVFIIICSHNNLYADLVEFDKIKRPALIYNIDGGGTGNQLFQYACAYNLAKKHKLHLYHSLSKEKMNERSFATNTRDYILDFFHVPQIDFVNSSRINVNLLLNEQDIMQGNIPSHIPNDKIFMLADYCESEIFFEDSREEIKNFYRFKEDKISDILSGLSEIQQVAYADFKNDIENTESVCVHIRRGDTTWFSYWTLPISYQVQAIKMMKARLNQPKFYIFSDDINDVKKNIDQSFDMTFVSEFNFPSIIDFYLMSKCKHNITTNSTFSWWAGYLNDNPEKIIIAPLPRYQDKWYEEVHKEPHIREHKRNLYINSSYSKDWLTINPFDNKSQ